MLFVQNRALIGLNGVGPDERSGHEKVRLKKLVEEGALIKNGSGRGTFYVRSDSKEEWETLEIQTVDTKEKQKWN